MVRLHSCCAAWVNLGLRDRDRILSIILFARRQVDTRIFLPLQEKYAGSRGISMYVKNPAPKNSFPFITNQKLYHQDVDRVVEITRTVLRDLWPQYASFPPSHLANRDTVKQPGIKPDISTLYRTYDTLLSLTSVEVLEECQDERAKLEEEMWYDTIRDLQSGSGLQHVLDTVFLPLYSSLDEKWAEESFNRCRKCIQPQGVSQCRWKSRHER